MEIGDRLRSERLRLGYNQSDFAALAGITKNSQFNYEKGERSPDADYLAAIGKAGVDVLYVLTGEYAIKEVENLEQDEAKLLSYYRQISPGDRATVMNVATAMMMARGLITED